MEMTKLTKSKQFTIGKKVFYLDRSFPNNSGRVVEMVVRKNPESNQLEVYGESGYFTIRFDINDDFIERVQNSPHPVFFTTHDDAMACYDSEIQVRVDALLNASIDETLRELYNGWSGNHLDDYRIYQAMRKKIKKEFNVDLE